ncbi:hypothetical protein [Micromonospora sp. WMMD998]|uniref:allene oxide cyclase barrel-like domain-containing protein n=1 Tax=Micromonospora sp. WMMD998 TaxID=3016092 RepID=UPI00249B0D50|nr:hypothetical protein [Micromonospora sp. WMMD998]WFE39904.1 hypothetical protein O7619_16285 [Micromonospora sp. WMMD998]
MRKPRPKRLTALLSAIVLGGATTVVLGGSVASAVPARHGKRCSVTSGLTDRSQLTKHDGRAPGTTDGDSVVYHDDVYNKAGDVVFTGEGTVLVYTNPRSGALWEFLAITIQMPSGGTYFGTTTFAIEDAVAGNPQTIPVVGTAGDTVGKVGAVKWSLVGYEGPNLSIFDVTATFCG